MANLDTDEKRHAGLGFPTPTVPRNGGSDADTTIERGQLVGAYGSFTFVVASVAFLVVNRADETAVGAVHTFYAEAVNDLGVSTAFDAAPRIRLWRVESDGSHADTAAATMTQVGATNVWKYDWTPTAEGAYSAFVYGEVSSDSHVADFAISARSKFDPIALGLHDTLVSRF